MDVRLGEGHFDDVMVHLFQALLRTAPEKLIDGVVVVTSANDARHSEGSYHYHDRALDVRCYGDRPGGGLTEDEAESWAERLRKRLQSGYDVILEEDHIHLERDA